MHQDEDLFSCCLDARDCLARLGGFLHMVAHKLCIPVDGVQHLLLAAPQADAGELLCPSQQPQQRGHAGTWRDIHEGHHCVQPV